MQDPSAEIERLRALLTESRARNKELESRYSYASMCRMDHIEIGHADNGDDEKCPLCRERDEARARLRERDAELLRVRTLGHAAAHELDNIAVELGLGHSPRPGAVADAVRELRNAFDTHRRDVNSDEQREPS